MAVTGDGTYNAPTPVTATQVGTYTWLATYTGDGLNNGAIDNGTNESLTTVKASPTIATAASEHGRAGGGHGGAQRRGDAQRRRQRERGLDHLHADRARTARRSPRGTVTVTGDGTYNSPTPVTATQVGTYTWQATYSGRRSEQRGHRQRHQRVGDDGQGEPDDRDGGDGETAERRGGHGRR